MYRINAILPPTSCCPTHQHSRKCTESTQFSLQHLVVQHTNTPGNVRNQRNSPSNIFLSNTPTLQEMYRINAILPPTSCCPTHQHSRKCTESTQFSLQYLVVQHTNTPGNVQNQRNSPSNILLSNTP